MEKPRKQYAERHIPCPCGKSSDAYCTYTDGTSWCHSCGQGFIGGEVTETVAKEKTSPNFIQGEVRAIPTRKLSQETCDKWHYKIGRAFNRHEGKEQICHIANYYERTEKGLELKGQKLRFPDKNFTWIGSATQGLYGKWLWQKGKYIVITEGELDALAVSEANGNRWPVVSIPHGASSAEATIKKDLKWLEANFESIVLMFDQDAVGIAAMQKIAPLFIPNKCKIASISEKDPCDMLLAGKVEELCNAVFNAKTYRPDGIVTLEDVRVKLDEPVEYGLSYPWKSLTELTNGIRIPEMITLGAGTGMGKTEVFKEIVVWMRKEHNKKVGVIFLEESNLRTSLSLAGKVMNKPIHRPDCVEYSKEEKDKALDMLQGDQDLVFYDHFGYMDYESIKQTIRHMVVVMGCKYIFIDHISALVSGDMDNDERKMLDFICTDLASLMRELNFTIFQISHLSTPGGDKSHEEGARVQLKHLRGSRGIGQWSNFVFALERNQQDGSECGLTMFRVLKDRETGQGTGKTFQLYYDSETGRLLEAGDYKGEFQDDEQVKLKVL